MNEANSPETSPMSPEDVANFIEAARCQCILFDKQLRVDIDALIQRLLGQSAYKTAERTLALRALQTAKHWLGEDLAILNDANPYPNGNNPSNTTVDPRTDVASTPPPYATEVGTASKPGSTCDSVVHES